ncbi:hypothetical protein FAZ19_23285 [Sphingobacterium alkalisoli]|uniref:Lipoprotein n=1 Tax=Sphingobacterium alkalisoli TaxID=1874115 RepID=A0A4U0GMK7_9SPHI|nr:hypothetical protein [Sphingobacterium alkalisoli]TJY60071.1 hypothetical protein FAZ19_23285 [Sphingobacterium alkalisoli]
MKYKLLFKSALVCLSCLLLASKCAMDYYYPLSRQNNSDENIYFHMNRNTVHSYPDSIIYFEEQNKLIIYPDQKKEVAGGGLSWEKIYKGIPKDTISFFIINADTLAKYPREVVNERYMILRRYDLSIFDLQKLDYTLRYPPTEAMRDMKMYPKYVE